MEWEKAEEVFLPKISYKHLAKYRKQQPLKPKQGISS